MIASATVGVLCSLAALAWWAYRRGEAAGELRAERETAQRSQAEARAKVEALERLLAETRAELASSVLNPAYQGSTELRSRQQQRGAGHASHEGPDGAPADRLRELPADLPAIERKTGELSSEAARGESEDEGPHVGSQEETNSLASPRKKQMRSPLPSDGPPSPMRPFHRAAIRLSGWIIPPTAPAVLQKDHDALQEEALRFIETEINRAYTALGPPPGLEGPALGGQLDVERD